MPTANGQASKYQYLFAGMESDPTGLYHTLARYYSPRLQRSLSEDPLQFGGGQLNLFAYAGNDPIDLADPLGMDLPGPRRPHAESVRRKHHYSRLRRWVFQLRKLRPGLSLKFIGAARQLWSRGRQGYCGPAERLGFGAIYTGGLKNVRNAQGLQRLREVRAAVKLPIVAIGGIPPPTVPDVLAAGANAAAIITDIVHTPDIRAKVRAILSAHPPALKRN